MTHAFDAAIELSPIGPHRFAGKTHAGYANMVGPFGGITAAVMLRGVLCHPERLGDPISLTVNFAGPLTEGAFELQAQPVRTNRSTQQWVLTLTQEGQGACTATAVSAVRRETWSMPEATPPANKPTPETLAALPLACYPAWVARYDMRFVEGMVTWPPNGELQSNSQSVLWIRDTPARAIDFASLTAICDSFLPRIFVRRRQFVPIGTVSFTCYFHADATQLAAQGEDYVLASARALNFSNGYFDQTGEIWSRAGTLLASTHQVVYYRE